MEGKINQYAKNHFQKGGANLQVCLNSRQGIATFLKMIFGKK